MARTRCGLILYFRMMAHKPAWHILLNAFFRICEDMVKILLILKVHFTQDSEDEEICSMVLLPALNPAFLQP